MKNPRLLVLLLLAASAWAASGGLLYLDVTGRGMTRPYTMLGCVLLVLALVSKRTIIWGLLPGIEAAI